MLNLLGVVTGGADQGACGATRGAGAAEAVAPRDGVIGRRPARGAGGPVDGEDRTGRPLDGRRLAEFSAALAAILGLGIEARQPPPSEPSDESDIGEGGDAEDLATALHEDAPASGRGWASVASTEGSRTDLLATTGEGGRVELDAEAGWMPAGDERFLVTASKDAVPGEDGVTVLEVERRGAWGDTVEPGEIDAVLARLRAEPQLEVLPEQESAGADEVEPAVPEDVEPLVAMTGGMDRRGAGVDDESGNDSGDDRDAGGTGGGADDAAGSSPLELIEVNGSRAPGAGAGEVGGDSSSEPVRTGAASSAGEPRGADFAGRVARVLELQDELAAQPVSRVVLRLDDEGGSGGTRVRLGVQGTIVEAEISLSDPLAVERLQSRVDELSRALQRQGLDPASLRIGAAGDERAVLAGRTVGEGARELAAASVAAELGTTDSVVFGAGRTSERGSPFGGREGDGDRDPARRELDRREDGFDQDRSRGEHEGEDWR